MVYFSQMPRGHALHLRRTILGRIRSNANNVWTTRDFLDLGARSAVDTALRRLADAGDLRRVDRGLYDQPRLNSLTGRPAVPDHRAVIDAVARRDRARLLVDPMTAANDLGLTTAVPAHVAVQTDARLKPLNLGNLELQFKQTVPSKLYWAGRPAMRVVQALYWVRDLAEQGDEQVLQRLRSILDKPDSGAVIREDLRGGIHTLPTWMQTIVRKLLSTHTQAGSTRA